MADFDISIGTKVDDFGKNIRKLPGMTESAAKAATKAYEKELKKQEKATDQSTGKMGKAFGKLGSAVGTASNALGGLAAAALAVAAAYKTVKDEQAKVIRGISDMSTRTTLSADSLNGLRLAARSAGLEFEELVPEDLAVRIMEAAEGSGVGADAFGKLGIAATDASGNLRSGEAVFRDIIDALTRMEDKTHAAALADDLFSDAGTRLLNTFSNLEDFDRFVQLGQKFGYEVGPEAVKQTNNWNSAMGSLQLAFEDALADLDELVGEDTTKKVNDFALGFIYLKAAAKNIFSGDMSMEGFHQALEEAKAEAYEFWKTQNGITEQVVHTFDEGLSGAYLEFIGASEDAGKAAEQAGPKIVKPIRKAADETTKSVEKTNRVHFNALGDLLARNQEMHELKIDLQKDAEKREIEATEAAKARAKELADYQRDLALQAASAWAEAFEIGVGGAIDLAFENASEKAMESGDKLTELVDKEKDLKDELRELNKTFLEDMENETDSAKRRDLQRTYDIERDKLERKQETAEGDIKAQRKIFKEQKKNALAMFAAQKAATIAGIAMQTAIAVTTAMGPPPYGAGVGGALLIGGIIASGAAQAAIAAAQKPPKFKHTGGIITSSDGSDQVPIIARTGESVLTQRATNSIGRDGVAAMNNGTANQPLVVLVQIGDQQIQDVVYKILPAGTVLAGLNQTFRPGVFNKRR